MDTPKLTFKNVIMHFKTICIHRWWVCYYCFKMRIPFQGLVHDLSKFSPVEFFESARYYQGTSSPIEAAQADKGYSEAWFHHRGRNRHHHVYWQDNFDSGCTPIKIPEKYLKEMLCDFLGAGRAYNGKSFTFEDEYIWWMNKMKSGIAMTQEDKDWITEHLYNIMVHNRFDYFDHESTNELEK